VTDQVPFDSERNETDGGEASGEPTMAESPDTDTESTPLGPFATTTSCGDCAEDTPAGSNVHATANPATDKTLIILTKVLALPELPNHHRAGRQAVLHLTTQLVTASNLVANDSTSVTVSYRSAR
jgi:hypothetical protein